jgi:hypothetical protein
MQRRVLHNRLLADWIHRAANGAIGGMVACGLVTAAARLTEAPFWLLWLAVPIGLLCMVPSPKRFTLVEGCAGEMGHDELLKD